MEEQLTMEEILKRIRATFAEEERVAEQTRQANPTERPHQASSDRGRREHN